VLNTPDGHSGSQCSFTVLRYEEKEKYKILIKKKKQKQIRAEFILLYNFLRRVM